MQLERQQLSEAAASVGSGKPLSARDPLASNRYGGEGFALPNCQPFPMPQGLQDIPDLPPASGDAAVPGREQAWGVP